MVAPSRPLLLLAASSLPFSAVATTGYAVPFHLGVGHETMAVHVGSTLVGSEPVMTHTMTLENAKIWCHHNVQCGGFRYMGTAINNQGHAIEFMGTSTKLRTFDGSTAWVKFRPGFSDPTLTTHHVSIRLDSGDGECQSRDDVAMSQLVYCKDSNGAWAKNGGVRYGCRNSTNGQQLQRGMQWPTRKWLDFGWHIDKNGNKLSTDDDFAVLNVVALRFKELGIPKNADITSAKIEMFAERANIEVNPAHFKIFSEKTHDAKCFSQREMANWKRFGLPEAQASTEWHPSSNCDAHPEHCINKGQFFDTPDLAHIIQPLVDGPDWDESRPMAFFVKPDRWDELQPNQVPSPCSDPKCTAGKCTYCNGKVDGMFRLSAYAWDMAGDKRDPYKVPHLQITYTTGCHVTCAWDEEKGHIEIRHPFRSRGRYQCAHDRESNKCSCTCDRAPESPVAFGGLTAAAIETAAPTYLAHKTCVYTQVAGGLATNSGCRDGVNKLHSSYSPTEAICKDRCTESEWCHGFEFTFGAKGTAFAGPHDGNNCILYNRLGPEVYTGTDWQATCYTKGECGLALGPANN